MNKNTLLVAGIIFISALLLGVSVYLSSSKIREGLYMVQPPATSSSSAQPVLSSSSMSVEQFVVSDDQDKSAATKISYMDLVLPTDLADDRKLVGYSQNVFVGRVIKQVGSKSPIAYIPKTQFRVDIIFNIKGGLQGAVVVSQSGGYRNGVLYVVRGGDVYGPSGMDGAAYFLRPGVTYLFATRYRNQENWYDLIAFPTASKIISDDSVLSVSQLQVLAANNSRVKGLQAAYPNEILLENDIHYNNTLNSYQSLTEEQKYALPYYTGPYRPYVAPPASTTSTASSTATSTGQ